MDEAATTVALLQVNAGNDLDQNIAAAAALVREAKARGAAMAFMPENVAMMEWGRENILARAFPEDTHPALAAFRELACGLNMWLHCGSLHVLAGNGGKAANRSLVLSPEGEIVGRYDKIHMFDAELPGGERYRESATFAPGDRAVVAETGIGRIGLSVCYDLRFPQLYRALAQAGAEILAVPAAFTRTTGVAHWHVLLRARAIETGCWVVAAAQTGKHPGGRETFGHSLVVDPWGRIVADGDEAPGLILAEIDRARVAATRKTIPSLAHDRPYGFD